ncbi:hypothetical protein Bhyg_06860 [Pseudolycoriella hygida]|uniref:Uncharacterized protein n=1 Tax=Pseudolycoriella hygida TaxID=35572 RepID=A0A9Q0N1M0_9DIPT|nr:hypothetical protein Bhyg_06860 [Pseudolycoriella hygida]
MHPLKWSDQVLFLPIHLLYFSFPVVVEDKAKLLLPVFNTKVVLALALACVAAKPDPALLYTSPTIYSAPLASVPIGTSLPIAAPLTYSSSYRPYSYAAPYAYSAYNTYNYRAPLTYY